MKNVERVVTAAIQGETLKVGAISTNKEGIYSYQARIATRTGHDSWKVENPRVSVTTTKHANGVAHELIMRGYKVEKS